MAPRPRFPPAILAQLRKRCLILPEALEYERWDWPTFRVGRRVFAEAGCIPDGDENVVAFVTVKAGGEDRQQLVASGHPFFLIRSGNSPNSIGVILDDNTDWDEVAEVITDSYCEVAPRRLADQVARPD